MLELKTANAHYRLIDDIASDFPPGNFIQSVPFDKQRMYLCGRSCQVLHVAFANVSPIRVHFTGLLWWIDLQNAEANLFFK